MSIRFLKSKKFRIILISVIGLYLLLLFCFYLFSNRFIYQRTSLEKEHKFSFKTSYEEYFITTPDSISINALLFKSATPSKGLLFYLHGNADNLDRWGKFAEDFTQLGYDVFMFDYRGYGKSSGTPTEDDLYKDASFILNWVKSTIPYSKLVIYGRSLGSAVASHLAIEASPNLLILETPFADFRDAIYWLLRPAMYLFPIKANFSNKNALAKVTCKKIIFHGTNDWVVPISSAQKLKPFLNQIDHFVTIPGGGHRNLNEFELYHTALAEALQPGK